MHSAASLVLPDQFLAAPVQQVHPELAKIVASDAQFTLLAEGFLWSEGPVAEPKSNAILFSDVPANKVYRWHPSEGLSVYLSPSGATGLWSDDTRRQGANGLIFNQQQQLVLAQHGDRRLAILQKRQAETPVFETLVSHVKNAQTGQQQRFNSPNDLVQHADQSYYFTDPPYGLVDGDQSTAKELPFNGVWRYAPSGELQLLVQNLTRPNGLAFSPDQRFLYIANSDSKAAHWWRYEVGSDGLLHSAQLFADATEAATSKPGLPDGLKVTPSGHIFATGPGGVWIFHPDGRQLGLLQLPVASANLTFSHDFSQLYITASRYLLKFPLQPEFAKQQQ